MKYKINRGCSLLFWIVWSIPFILAFGGWFISLLVGEIDDNHTEEAADGFTIEEFNIDLDVKEDNKIDVVENIIVNWEDNYHHGIQRFIPNWLEYTSKNGETVKRKSKVLNLRTDLEPYTLTRVKKKDRIRIGYESKYVEEGLHTYQIKYTYDMGSDPYKGYDELIFHAFGDFWGTGIKKSSIHVTMPKSIEGYTINFFGNKYRGIDLNDYVDYEVSENKLSAKFNSSKYYNDQWAKYCSLDSHIDENGMCDYELFEYVEQGYLNNSLTLDIELPDHYFTKGSYNYGFISISFILVTLLLTGLVISWFIKYGKNHKKKARTLEFYPPDDLDSAEIGYIYKQMNSKKLVISLLVSLANKGYIKIDQEKNDFVITNLNKWPVMKSNTIKRKIVVNQLKETDDLLTASEKKVMEKLFQNGKQKELTSSFSSFDKAKERLIKDGYIEIVSDNSEEYNQEKEQLKAEYEKEYEKYMKSTRKFDTMSKNESIVYEALFEKGQTVQLSKHTTFYKAFDKVFQNVKTTLKYKIRDKEAFKYMWKSLLISFLVFVMDCINYFRIADMDPKLSFMYSVAWICLPICLFFTLFMGRKTEYGEIMKARVKGFKHFLTTAEKEQLEAMVLENPKYFYDILPYTYVLNVSRKWISKFEKIDIIKPDMGNFDYTSMSSWNDVYSSVYVPTSSGSSGSSSSCGGGCSSCGGGCSSCGGGGSW